MDLKFNDLRWIVEEGEMEEVGTSSTSGITIYFLYLKTSVDVKIQVYGYAKHLCVHRLMQLICLNGESNGKNIYS